jgi:hypothetical protein
VVVVISENLINTQGDDVLAITSPTGIGNNTSSGNQNDGNRQGQEREGLQLSLNNISQMMSRRQPGAY